MYCQFLTQAQILCNWIKGKQKMSLFFLVYILSFLSPALCQDIVYQVYWSFECLKVKQKEDHSKATQLQEYESRLGLFINRFPPIVFKPSQAALNLFQKCVPFCVKGAYSLAVVVSIESCCDSISRTRQHFASREFWMRHVVPTEVDGTWSWSNILNPLAISSFFPTMFLNCLRPGWWLDPEYFSLPGAEDQFSQWWHRLFTRYHRLAPSQVKMFRKIKCIQILSVRVY